MANSSIEVIFTRAEEQPDGSKCQGCGDSIFLTQFRIWLTIAGKASKTDIVLCGSCSEHLFIKSENG